MSTELGHGFDAEKPIPCGSRVWAFGERALSGWQCAYKLAVCLQKGFELETIAPLKVPFDAHEISRAQAAEALLVNSP